MAKTIDSFYGSFITAGTYLASSVKVAEAAKVIENSQRDNNIALVNELAIIFNKLGIDTHEVLEGHGGESRDARLAEFLIQNPTLPLVGLRECSLIEIKGDKFYLKGRGSTMKLFRKNGKHEEIEEGEFDPSNW